MRQKEGIASVLEEEAFEKKLLRLSRLPYYEKRKRLVSIDRNESVRFQDHQETNESIEQRKLFEMEWKKENPDGEYHES